MTTETNKPKDGNAPKNHAYYVVEATRRGQKDRWNRIGVMFAHVHGDGGTLILDSIPINFDGRIVMRAPNGEQGEGQ